jgi:hypothetical protein
MAEIFSERIVEIANEVFGDTAQVEVKYDKCRQATVSVNVVGHYFELVEVSSGVDDILDQTDGDEKCYFVYRNDLLVCIGTETYSKVFYELVRKMFELTM